MYLAMGSKLAGSVIWLHSSSSNREKENPSRRGNALTAHHTNHAERVCEVCREERRERREQKPFLFLEKI